MLIKEPYGFIYITTNMINGKRYIGQKKFEFGTQNEKRWESYLGSGALIKKAIKKYGKKNFYKDIVAIAYSKEELDELEKEWVYNYNADISDDFYNIAEGGHNNPLLGKSQEEVLLIREKQSETLKQRYSNNEISPWNKNKELSEEHKVKLSEAKRGKKWSEKQYEAHSNYKGSECYWYGKKRSNEDKAKMSESRKGKCVGKDNHKAKKVICLTTKKVFNTISEAKEYYNINGANISTCCKGKRKYCGKLEDGTPLEWMYYDDYLKKCV